jgi:type IV pilus assembly protein PilW
MKQSAHLQAARGFSLIELMVSMAIALVVTLAVFGVLAASEDRKRTSTALNDANQTGAYAAHLIDRSIRSAGSGFTQRWNEVVGCRLNAVRTGVGTVLPRTNAWPAPFAAMPLALRAAPVLIGRNLSGGGSDVLFVMAGATGFAESGARVQPSSTSTDSLRLPNTLALRANDLVLVAQDGLGCLLEQVASSFTGGSGQSLPFGGTYYTATGADVSLQTFSTDGQAYVVPLGNATDNLPQMQLYGVGANNTLFSYDVLRPDGTDTSVPVAEGVVELRAAYGVDSNNDRQIDTWVSPDAAPFDLTSLTDGSRTARDNLRSILAVRVGLVLRSALAQREEVAPATLAMFQDLVATAQPPVRALTADERHYRHRVVETTIPLRNVLLLPAL